MDKLTARILEYEGVVVDYAGDGIMAMWNAPTDGARPCHQSLPRWPGYALATYRISMRSGVAGLQEHTLKIGLGLNTGPAMCGNTGAEQRFKYGPLGHTVNLASRVEGATKPAGRSSAHHRLDAGARSSDKFATRRLCKVRRCRHQGSGRSVRGPLHRASSFRSG